MKVVQCEHGHYYDAEKYSECPMCKKEKNKIVQAPTEKKKENITRGKEPSSQIQQNKVDLSKLKECEDATTITSIIDDQEPSTMKPNENIEGKTTHYVHPKDTETFANFRNNEEYQHKENNDKQENIVPIRPDDNGETQIGFDAFNKSTYPSDNDHTSNIFNEKPVRPDDNSETQVEFGGVKEVPEDQYVSSYKHIPSKKNNGPVVGWLVAIGGPHIGQSFELFAKKNFIGRNDTMAVNLFNDKTVSRTSPLSIVFNRRNNKFMAMAGNSDQTAYINDDLVLQPTELSENDEIVIGNTTLVFIPLLKDGKGIEEFYKVG